VPEHGSRAVRLEVSVYRDRFLESLISFFFFWHGGGEPLPFYKGMMDVPIKRHALPTAPASGKDASMG